MYLPALDFFIYVFTNVRHYLQKHKEWENIYKLLSELEKLFMVLDKDRVKRGVPSKFYNVLQEESPDSN